MTARLVPPPVVWRPKGGFEIPGGAWTGPIPEPWLADSWVASQFGMSSETLRRWLASIGEGRDRMFFATMEIWGRLFALRTPLAVVQDEWSAGSGADRDSPI